jgi:hypothetical protein
MEKDTEMNSPDLMCSFFCVCVWMQYLMSEIYQIFEESISCIYIIILSCILVIIIILYHLHLIEKP